MVEEQPRPSRVPAEQIPSVDILNVVLSALIVLRKRFVILRAGVLLGIVLAALLCLVLPATYTGTVKILQPRQKQSISSIVSGQLGPLAGLAGAELSGKGPTDQYLAILKSRTVAVNIINRFHLMDRYRKKTLQDAIQKLEDVTQVSIGRDSTITIAFDDKDPAMAAAVANAYAEELDKLAQNLQVTDASQQRLFFEKQLRGAKDSLSDAEYALQNMEESRGVIQPESQTKAIVEAETRLRALIAAKEVEVRSMQSFATNENADLARARLELGELQAQLAKIGGSGQSRKGDLRISARDVPQVGLEYARRLRDVKYYEAVFELLGKQYVAAKIDEAKDTSNIQVLDHAVPPEERSKPNRLLIALSVILAALLVSALLAFLYETLELAKENPTYASRLDFLLNRHNPRSVQYSEGRL